MDQPSLYPRTYRCGWGTRTFFLCLGALMSIFGGWLIYVSFAFSVFANLILGTFIIFCCMSVIVIAFRVYVKLFNDRVEYQGIFARRIIYYSEILAVKILSDAHFKLYTNSPKLEIVRLMNFVERDEVFSEWIANLPTLDTVKVKTLLENPAFGGTPEQRKKSIRRDKIIIWTFGAVCIGLLTWLFWLSYGRIALYGLFAIPLAAVLLTVMAKGRWQLTYDPISPKLSLIAFVWVPSVILMGMCLPVLIVIDWIIPLVIIFGLSLTAIAGLALIERRFDGGFLMNVLWVLPYVLATGLFLNFVLPHQSDTAMPFKIVETPQNGFFIPLSNPAVAPKPVYVFATPKVYSSAKVGQTLCAWVYTGAFGWKGVVRPDHCRTNNKTLGNRLVQQQGLGKTARR